MFSLSKASGNSQYLYMIPVEEGVAQWELIPQEELDRRVEKNLLQKGCKLFKIEKEIQVTFEQLIHLD